MHEDLARQEVDASGGAKPGRRRKAFAAGRLSGREEARFAAVMKEAERAAAAFADAAPFWP